METGIPTLLSLHSAGRRRALGAMLVEHAQPTAYCVAGPDPTVVVTTATLRALDRELPVG